MSLTNLYLRYFYENFDLLHLINFMSPLINNNRENNIKILGNFPEIRNQFLTYEEMDKF